jgi:hydrogenase small subunit
MSVDVSKPAGVEEVHILWTSEGMSCDGDTIAMTAAGLPSIEEIALGLIPGLPKVHLHNKVLSPTLGGEEYMAPFRAAARGELDAPYVLVVEGSIPNENINGDGYWTSMGNDPVTGEPITFNEWIDRLAPGARPTAASMRWRATRPAPWGSPTTSAGTSAPRGTSRS